MIPQGYKQTEIGEIPRCWDIIPFDKCFKILSNNTLSRAELSDNVGMIKNIHYGDILVKYKNILNCSTEAIPYIRESKKIALMFLANGDLIMADTAEDEAVGKATEISNIGEQKIVSGLHTIPCRPICSKMFANGWLGYYINHAAYHDQLLPFITGTKVSAISKSSISGTLILVPPIEEQKRIAEALSDVDNMISSLEKLIAKKKAVKQGAMQELLTGRKRLPGFIGEWRKCKLKDVLTVGHGQSQQAIEDVNGKYPILATGGIIGRANSYLYDHPSVLIGRKGTIDKPQYMETPFWTIDTLFYTKISTNYHAKYIFYVFCLIDWLDYNEASGVPSLSASVIENIDVIIPELREQVAIASILCDIDNEIESLEQKLSKTRQIKQGMMQQLLTGKIRLK